MLKKLKKSYQYSRQENRKSFWITTNTKIHASLSQYQNVVYQIIHAKLPKLRWSKPTNAVKLRHKRGETARMIRRAIKSRMMLPVATSRRSATPKPRTGCQLSRTARVAPLVCCPGRPGSLIATWRRVRQCACSSLGSPFTWLGWNGRQSSRSHNSCRLVDNFKTSHKIGQLIIIKAKISSLIW